jgi:DNA topoisomerase IB
MARRGGWRRRGAKGRFRYHDARGKRITDAEKLGRIEELAIPPAWRDVWISPHPRAKLQATGIDRAGRGTLIAAIAFAEHGLAESETEAKRVVAGVMRAVGEKLGNTPAVARSSYVSPAVVEQYLDGRTLDDFCPRHLRVVGARDTGLDREERALLSLLRSWRIRRARVAA